MPNSMHKEHPDGDSYCSHLAIAFRYEHGNRYSFLPLTASLEVFPELAALEIVRMVFPYGKSGCGSFMDLLERTLQTHDRVVLCYSFMTPQWPDVVQELRLLAEHIHRKRIFLLAGGPHPSGSPKRTLEAGFDAVCVGEGEEAFPRLLLTQIARERIENIPGIYFRTPSGTRSTGKPSPVDWDRFPVLPFLHGKLGPMEITRGCPFGCKYCQTPVVKGRKVRHRSPELIFKAVERMAEANRLDVRFITPNALAYGSPDGRHIHMQALTHLLHGIRKRLPSRGRIFFGSFPSEVRPDFVTPESADLVRSTCHNKMIVLGAQSGNAEMLQKMGRGHDPRTVLRACDILSQRGFDPVVDFILGLPGETLGQMLDTLSFMEELARRGARIHAHTFIPLPGSPWGGLRAQPLPPTIRKRMEQLSSRGILFGQWKKQERTVLLLETASIVEDPQFG